MNSNHVRDSIYTNIDIRARLGISDDGPDTPYPAHTDGSTKWEAIIIIPQIPVKA